MNILRLWITKREFVGIVDMYILEEVELDLKNLGEILEISCVLWK